MKYAFLLFTAISVAVPVTCVNAWGIPPRMDRANPESMNNAPRHRHDRLYPRAVAEVVGNSSESDSGDGTYLQPASVQLPASRGSEITSMPPQLTTQTHAGHGSTTVSLPVPTSTPVPLQPYSTCTPEEINPAANSYASSVNYFTYASHTGFDSRRRSFEEQPRLGLVFESSGAGQQYFAAASDRYWYWSDSYRYSSWFNLAGYPRLEILCDTPGRKNAWVPYTGQNLEDGPAYRVLYHSFYREPMFVESGLCAYEHNGQKITGVILDNRPNRMDLPNRYQCAGLIVTATDHYTLKINTDNDFQTDNPDVAPFSAPLRYILAGVPASEPDCNPSCQTPLEWYEPEAALAERTLSKDEVIASYPPEGFIHYCLGYSSLSGSTDIVRTFGVELPTVNYSYMPSGNAQTYTGQLAGGCLYPGEEEYLEPYQFIAGNTESAAEDWVSRYRRLRVPVDSGWQDYDPDYQKGTRAGCQSTYTGADPVYLCRFISTADDNDDNHYVYGVLRSGSGNAAVCRAVRVYENENSLPVYGMTTATKFQVYKVPDDSGFIEDLPESSTALTSSPSAVFATVMPLFLTGLSLWLSHL